MLKSRLAGAGAVMLHEDYGADGVALRFTVPRAVVAELEVTAANITRGRSAWEILS